MLLLNDCFQNVWVKQYIDNKCWVNRFSNRKYIGLSKHLLDIKFWHKNIVKESKYGAFSGPYSIRVWENTNQKKLVFGHFSRSENDIWNQITVSNKDTIQNDVNGITLVALLLNLNRYHTFSGVFIVELEQTNADWAQMFPLFSRIQWTYRIKPIG